MTGPEDPAPASADVPHGPEPDVSERDALDLDVEDAFGHPAVPDPARDDAMWPDGDEDDLDV